MRTIQSVRPGPVLRPFIRAFAHRTTSGALESQAMPAFLETVIHFDFADVLGIRSSDGGLEMARPLALVGPHTRAGTSLRFDGNIDSFAVFLQPTALWSLFGVPTSAVVETHYDAADVLGAPIAELWNVLADRPGFDDRIRAVERFLLTHARFERQDTLSTAAASIVTRQGGCISVSELAVRMHVSVRQLERAFLHEMGMSPKYFAQVSRFQTALDARIQAPKRTWLDIAIGSGYHDQMHLIHDFKSMAGFAPGLTVSRLGDSRPSALADSHSDDRQ